MTHKVENQKSDKPAASPASLSSISPSSPSRRQFLTTTGLVAAAAAAPRSASALAAKGAAQSGEKAMSPGSMRKIPIGVFDPAFPDLSTDAMIDKFVALGVE